MTSKTFAVLSLIGVGAMALLAFTKPAYASGPTPPGGRKRDEDDNVIDFEDFRVPRESEDEGTGSGSSLRAAKKSGGMTATGEG